MCPHANGSLPSPWPPRRYGWIVTLHDEETIREFYAEPPTTRWDTLDLDRITELVLEDAWPIGEEDPLVRVDCTAGRLWVRDAEVRAWIGDEEITRTEQRVVPVQRKHAASTFNPATRTATQSVTAQEAGFMHEHDEGRVRLSAKVATSDGRILLTLNVLKGERLRGKPAVVTVDGARLDMAQETLDQDLMDVLGPRRGA